MPMSEIGGGKFARLLSYNRTPARIIVNINERLTKEYSIACMLGPLRLARDSLYTRFKYAYGWCMLVPPEVSIVS